MSFLNAEWRKLILVNYEIDPSILAPYVPAKTELDLWNGRCYVSLVGFMFVNTKMLGLKIPFHVNFEEVNLRFYVKHYDGKEKKRGVVFIKEIVPRHAISIVANTLYKEHYVTMPMRHEWRTEGEMLDVTYEWKHKGKWQKVGVQAVLKPEKITLESETGFITEHYWGYTKVNDQKTLEYEVTHPTWQAYPIQDYTVNVDFGAVYGNDFQLLNHLKPTSVMLAEGSEITVEAINAI